MGKMKKLLSMLLAVIIILGTVKSVPVEAKSNKYYWFYSKQIDYNYENGKWEEECQTSFKYNKRGDTTQHNYISPGSSYTEKTVYDKSGNIKKILFYEKGKLTHKSIYKYNKAGNNTQIKYYDNGKLVSTDKYKYDKKNNWIKCTTTFTNKSRKTEVSSKKIKYKKNVVIKEETKYSDGSKSIYEYYKNGNEKYSKYTSADYKSEEYYNKNGKCTKSVIDDSTFKTVTTYTYKNGKIIKSTEVSTDKTSGTTTTTIHTYENKLDKNKNILECVEYIDDQPVRKTVYSGYKKYKNNAK